jgi:glycosyltransferase involved in cell wall biosynthesis
MSTTVSVVIPTRNRSALLAVTLRSVLWQRDVDVEVIVVDEASTDATCDVVASFADPRVAIVRNRVPCGPGAARNRGAELTSGEWVGFVDDDDVWAPDKLARQVAAADATGADWAYGGTVNVAGDLEIVSGSPPPGPDDVVTMLPRYNAIPGGCSNVILRRRLLREVGGFNERLPPCEDWEMWVRLAHVGRPAVSSHPLAGYRVHGGNASLDVEKVRRAALLIEKLHDTDIDWGRLHRWLAESCLRMERHGQALTEFGRAAMRGHAVGVWADIAAIVRRRVRRAVGAQHEEGLDSTRTWAAEALPWLHRLKEDCRVRPPDRVSECS